MQLNMPHLNLGNILVIKFPQFWKKIFEGWIDTVVLIWLKKCLDICHLDIPVPWRTSKLTFFFKLCSWKVFPYSEQREGTSWVSNKAGIHLGGTGDSVAKWLGRRTWIPEVTGASPALTTNLELFLSRPKFSSLATFVNGHLVYLLPVVIFNHIMVICIICFICFHWPWKAPLGEWSI